MDTLLRYGQKTVLASLTLLLSLLTLSGNAQTVHAIVVADTKDPILSTACKRDVETMHRQFVQLATAINYQLSEQVIEGEEFTQKRLNEAIRTLSPGPDDILFLYYTGHGYNASRRAGRFPVLHLEKKEKDSQNNPGLLAIHETLKAKKARLCITMGDCCNQLIPNMRGMAKKAVTPRVLVLTNDSLNAVYRKLFLDTKGDALIASSRPPEQACAHPDSGSFYTRSFDEALELASRYNKTITWETLLRDTQTRLTRHHATRSKQSIYIVSLDGSRTTDEAWLTDKPNQFDSNSPVGTGPAISYDQVNRHLTELTDKRLSAQLRLAAMNRLADLFTKQARIYVYDDTMLGEVQPIEIFLRRLYLNAAHIQRINFIERLSKVSADGKHYERAAFNLTEADTRYVDDEEKDLQPTVAILNASQQKSPSARTVLTVSIRTDKGRTNVEYREGNELVVEAKANRPCHVRLVYVLADGTKALLENDYEIKPGQENQYVRIKPDRPLTCSAPFGMEYLLAYAAEEAFCPVTEDPNKTLYLRKEDGYDLLVGTIGEVIKASICTKRETTVAEDQIQITTRSRN